MKSCGTCKIEKPFTDFGRKAAGKYGLDGSCLVCCRIKKTRFYQENKESLLSRKKIYYENNKDKILAHCRRYVKENKEVAYKKRKDYKKTNKTKIRERMRNYEYNRYREDPQYRLSCLLRKRLRLAINKKNKNGSAVKDLGMKIQTFLVYLNLDCLDKYGIPYTGNEKFFELDHIRPLKSFNLQDPAEFKKATHWSNLQILTKKENRCKSDKII